jgi:hypothetical protein
VNKTGFGRHSRYLQLGFFEAKNFILELCLYKNVLVDCDYNQDRSYGKIVGVPCCDGFDVNAAILDKEFADIYGGLCSVSECGNSDWVRSMLIVSEHNL